MPARSSARSCGPRQSLTQKESGHASSQEHTSLVSSAFTAAGVRGLVKKDGIQFVARDQGTLYGAQRENGTDFVLDDARRPLRPPDARRRTPDLDRRTPCHLIKERVRIDRDEGDPVRGRGAVREKEDIYALRNDDPDHRTGNGGIESAQGADAQREEEEKRQQGARARSCSKTG